MEINLNLRQLALGAAAIGLIVLLAVVGHAVTPVAEGSPLVLTPERWEAAALARKAGAEIVRLEADGRALHAAVARALGDGPLIGSVFPRRARPRGEATSCEVDGRSIGASLTAHPLRGIAVRMRGEVAGVLLAVLLSGS